jgi:hypothetical protein
MSAFDLGGVTVTEITSSQTRNPHWGSDLFLQLHLFDYYTDDFR